MNTTPYYTPFQFVAQLAAQISKELKIQIKDEFNKRILTLSSTGTIREYELNYSVLYRIKNSLGEWGPSIKIKSITPSRLSSSATGLVLEQGLHQSAVK